MRLKTLRSLSKKDLEGKRVLVRVDYNVPIESGEVADDTRIRASLPTINYLLDKSSIPIITSHLGRPKGRYQRELSLKPVAQHLSHLLKMDVKFIEDLEHGYEDVDSTLKDTVYLLENTRFYSGETKNEEGFARILARYGEVFVNDAFGTLHRAHASTFGVAKLFSVRVAGLLVEREVRYLTQVRENPEKPYIVILGGAKVSDKIGVLENLLPKADYCMIGGGMAYTFLMAKGINPGKSITDSQSIDKVKGFLIEYADKVLLPEDHVITDEIKEGSSIELCEGDIPNGYYGVDIGPRTIARWTEVLDEAKTVFWNGPVGIFEIKGFDNGSIEIALKLRELTKRGVVTVTGGGDTIRALHHAGVGDDEVTHASTGGGATLEFLAGKRLPGLEVLQGKE